MTYVRDIMKRGSLLKTGHEQGIKVQGRIRSFVGIEPYPDMTFSQDAVDLKEPVFMDDVDRTGRRVPDI
jgi:hypothetical protein